jgi:chromosome segregation ATPase
MATLDELENRVRELSTEVEGEKVVTRQVYQQAVRNGDALRAVQLAVVEVTSRADHIVQEVIQNTAAVRTQGARLDSLTRDTGLLRNDLTLLRRDIEATNGRLDQLQADATQIKDSVAAILAAVSPATRGRHDHGLFRTPDHQGSAHGGFHVADVPRRRKITVEGGLAVWSKY